jgi:DnaK suppressor protein
MDQITQDKFRPFITRRLEEIAAELAMQEESTQPVSPDVSIGRLSRLDSMQAQQIALAGKRRLEDERGRLHEAMRRIETGSYGHCLLCRSDIATERLENQPDAVTCVPCLNRRK